MELNVHIPVCIHIITLDFVNLVAPLFCSVNKLCPTLRPQRLQHTRLPCSLWSTGTGSNSCPLSQWCYLTVSSFASPFIFLQSFPASGSFQMSQFFTSGSQNIGASASTSVLPINIQGWFPLVLTSLISLLSKKLSRVFSSTITQKHGFFNAQLFLWSNSYIHMWLWKNPSFGYMDLCLSICLQSDVSAF